MIPVSTDWFGLSIRLLDDVGKPPRDYTWEDYEGGTNVWSKRRVLYNRYGERVFTLLYSPKSSLIGRDMALFEVSNEWLYHGIGVGGCLKLLRRVVPFDVVSLSRLDLCADFVPSEGLAEAIFGLGSGSIYCSGKRSGSGFWSINTDDWMPDMWRGVRIPHCISWGHKTSDVKWKLYYKTKELRDALGGRQFDKPYIVDLWRECGLDVNNVWRLEVSIKHPSKLTLDGKVINFDVWYKDTLNLYKSLYVSRFQLRVNEGHADKSNDSIVPFLPISDASVVRCRKYEGDDTRSARIGLLRHLVRSLDQPEVCLDAPTRCDVVTTIDGIVRRDHLERYFEAMVERPYCEWIESYTGNDSDERYPMMSQLVIKGNHMPINSDFDRKDDDENDLATVSHSD